MSKNQAFKEAFHLLQRGRKVKDCYWDNKNDCVVLTEYLHYSGNYFESCKTAKEARIKEMFARILDTRDKVGISSSVSTVEIPYDYRKSWKFPRKTKLKGGG